MKHKFLINNVNETILLGQKLGSILNSNIIIGIDGELGAGKTHFTKGIALGLNIKDNITSPSFSLINEYRGENLDLYHFDVYRLNSIDELLLIGFDDYIEKNAVTIIEWASSIKEILPKETNYINIYNFQNDTNKRIMEFDFYKDYENILKILIDNFKER